MAYGWKRWALALAVAGLPALAGAQQTVKIAGLVELSGPGTTSGTNLAS